VCVFVLSKKKKQPNFDTFTIMNRHTYTDNMVVHLLEMF